MNYWYPLLSISTSIIVLDLLVVIYLKSLFPLDIFYNITRINHPLGMSLFIIYWIGILILVISLITSNFMLI